MEPLPTLPPKPRSFILPQSSTSKTSTTPVRPIIRPILRPIIRPSASTSGAPPKAPSAILTPVPLRLLQSAKTVTPIKRPPILPRPQIQPMLVYPPNQGQQQVKPPILLLPRPNQRKPMIFLPKPFTPAASSSSSSSTQNQSSQPQQKRNNVIQQPGTRYKRKRGRRGILLGEIEAPDQTEGVPGDDVGEDYIKLPNGRFQCTICNHTHCNLQCIKKHVSTVHKSMKLFKCPDCDKTFRQAYILRKHQKVHERQKPDAPTYGCDQCDYRTKHKFYIQSHIYRVHTDDYLFTCDRCGKRFKMKRELKDHQVLHNDETHICDICGKIFKGKHLLRNHKRNHTITDDFQCKTCRRKLCTQEALDKHMKLHNRVYECVDCGSQYGNKVSLEKHRNVHTRANAHECPMCHKVFADQATQKVHSLTHAGLKPYKCNVCGAGFTQRTPMMIHWRRKHPGETEPPPPVVLTGILKEMEEQLSTSKVPHANPE
ncbi:hypothetical protein QAD02_010900 [Eretmocerus hayati]|uniref:Uncharacterized protein n=1 Tax=Eretmocerus hayati TaxID=131215 RepID=A0ACC2NV37_9HYME|nr:hypothetical protein QAD02_010900 [Eretmocerus hayati]